LYEIIIGPGADDPSFCADNTGCYRGVQAEWSTDGTHPFSDFNFFRISDFRNRQAIVRFDFDQRDICVSVCSNYFSLVFFSVRHFYEDFVCFFDHMIVGENVSVITDDKS